ncbi:MAG: hypothetical protein IKJ72_00700 [Mycoplasmataceae bacterium]|nr:hypothetical protein [Mycoplasmataceae bacterium]
MFLFVNSSFAADLKYVSNDVLNLMNMVSEGPYKWVMIPNGVFKLDSIKVTNNIIECAVLEPYSNEGFYVSYDYVIDFNKNCIKKSDAKLFKVICMGYINSEEKPKKFNKNVYIDLFHAYLKSEYDYYNEIKKRNEMEFKLKLLLIFEFLIILFAFFKLNSFFKKTKVKLKG